jgi:hypothetical protein
VVILDKWEYKTIKFETKGFVGGILDARNFEDELNNLGEKGWEVVSCFPTAQSSGQSREIIAVLKRKIYSSESI